MHTVARDLNSFVGLQLKAKLSLVNGLNSDAREDESDKSKMIRARTR